MIPAEVLHSHVDVRRRLTRSGPSRFIARDAAPYFVPRPTIQRLVRPDSVYAVHLIQNGVAPRCLQALMGHESPDTTSRYLGLVKQDLRRAYDAAVEVILAGQWSPATSCRVPAPAVSSQRL